jgi:hypothetical protein
MRRRLVTLAVALALAVGMTPGPGAAEPEDLAIPGPGVPIVTLDALPLGVPTTELSGPNHARAESVLARSAFAQRVTGIRFTSREDVYRFLLDHPDFAASVARALRVGEYRVFARSDDYWGDDNRGATGVIRVLFADEQRRLYHLEGRYEQRWLPPVEAQLLVLLEFRHAPDEAGGTLVEQSLTGHIRIDTPMVGGLAQTLGTLSRPLVERAVEKKVRRFFSTVARVTRWAHDEPEQLAAALDGHPEVEPGATAAAFRALLLAGRPPAWVRTPFRLTSELPSLDGP